MARVIKSVQTARDCKRYEFDMKTVKRAGKNS